MKERITIKQLRDKLNSLGPEFDNYSILIPTFGEKKIFESDDIVVEFSCPTRSPTADKERQAAFYIVGRKEYEKMMKLLERKDDKDV